MSAFPSYIVTNGKGEVRYYNSLEFIQLIVDLGKKAKDGKNYRAWQKQNGIISPPNIVKAEVVIAYLETNQNWKFEQI